jgi:hypothetical protein
MSDIFISYNHEDRLPAQLFAQALEGRGWSIFWDRTIPTGKTWRETIGKELGEARCVIVLWSKTSIESEWVREKADDAKARRVLVPVRIDNVQPPIGFRGIQTADLMGWNAAKPSLAFDRLTIDIATLIGSPPAREPPVRTMRYWPPEQDHPRNLASNSNPANKPNLSEANLASTAKIAGQKLSNRRWTLLVWYCVDILLNHSSTIGLYEESKWRLFNSMEYCYNTKYNIHSNHCVSS